MTTPKSKKATYEDAAAAKAAVDAKWPSEDSFLRLGEEGWGVVYVGSEKPEGLPDKIAGAPVEFRNEVPVAHQADSPWLARARNGWGNQKESE